MGAQSYCHVAEVLSPKTANRVTLIGQSGYRGTIDPTKRLARVAAKVNPGRSGQSNAFVSTVNRVVNLPCEEIPFRR